MLWRRLLGLLALLALFGSITLMTPSRAAAEPESQRGHGHGVAISGHHPGYGGFYGHGFRGPIIVNTTPLFLPPPLPVYSAPIPIPIPIPVTVPVPVEVAVAVPVSVPAPVAVPVTYSVPSCGCPAIGP